jgi:RNA polymerase-binding transcription factor DksA
VEALTLKQVRAALQRIQDGTYGVCIDCGRRIEPARLEAVPWTRTASPTRKSMTPETHASIELS